jgi:PDZ-binding kinase
MVPSSHAALQTAQVRERRRVERTLEHESCMLASMHHSNIVGFRAAQRLQDGHLCLALEHCDISLYALLQERVKPHGSCVSPTRGSLVGEVFNPSEVANVGHDVASGLAYLHNEHRLLHGDVKSSNILLSRDLQRIKLCDLGVSIQLRDDLSAALHAGSCYDGTEPWRPPETLLRADRDFLDAEAPSADGLRICDRTDIFAFGLVLWEMLTGDVPHAEHLHKGDDVYRAALGTRPALPHLGPAYERVELTFRCCTQREPDRRPSARECEEWLASDATTGPPADLATEL